MRQTVDVTPAIVLLEKLGIDFTIHRYDHDPAAESFGMEAAEVLGLDPGVVFKTLMARLDGPGGELVVAIVPVDEMLDLKKLAKAAGTKKAAMADVSDAERATGYVAGGISPVGQRERHRAFVDETAEICDEVYVSGGQRGVDVSMAPGDLIAAADASYAPLT